MITFPHPDTAETRLAATFFVVEADSFAQHTFWAQHAEDSLHPPWDKRKNCRAYEPLEWEQVSSGWDVYVGEIAKRDIYISVNWARIEGQLVCFWYPTSQAVDTLKCEAWIDAHFTGRYDGGHRKATCDAMNFKHCLSAIREANKTLESSQP